MAKGTEAVNIQKFLLITVQLQLIMLVEPNPSVCLSVSLPPPSLPLHTQSRYGNCEHISASKIHCIIMCFWSKTNRPPHLSHSFFMNYEYHLYSTLRAQLILRNLVSEGRLCPRLRLLLFGSLGDHSNMNCSWERDLPMTTQFNQSLTVLLCVIMLSVWTISLLLFFILQEGRASWDVFQ